MITIRNNYNCMYKYRYIVYLFFFLVILSGCQSNNKNSSKTQKTSATAIPAANDDFFQEIGQQIGLDFVHSIGEEDLNNIIESVGGGAAFLDYDQDGFMDIYVCSGTWLKGFSKEKKPDKLPENHLYRNKGDGTFEDVTKKAGVGGPWYSMGITVGDFNNDGYPDIYLSNYGPNVLLKSLATTEWFNSNSLSNNFYNHGVVE
jgi:hypothetical protein